MRSRSPIMFITPAEQIKKMLKWEKKYKWNFGEYPIAPKFKQHDLTTLVLVPYFDTVQATVDNLWQVITDEYESTWKWDELKTDSRHLRLLKGITQPPKGLRWEVINLGANWGPDKGRQVKDVRGTNSAHAGILAAVCLFPSWFTSMDGVKVPYVDIAGYECSVQGFAPWRSVPYIDRDDSRVSLSAYWDVLV